MTQSTPTFIHIGIHKTGSSTLQQKFRTHPSMYYVERADVRNAFIGHLLDFNEAPFQAETERATEQGKALVMSHERLTGYPASGGFDREIIAARLAKAFPDAKILVLFREQSRWIKSFYQQYVADGGGLTLKEFLTNPQPQIYKLPAFELDYLNYHKLVSLYHNNFGAENVLALPYELMVQDFDSFTTRLNAFFGFDLQLENEVTNRSRPLMPLLFMRFVNGTIGNTQLSPGGFVPLGYLKLATKLLGKIPGARSMDKRISTRFDRLIEEKIEGYYDESNGDLEALIGMDLKPFGYFPDTIEAQMQKDSSPMLGETSII
ncbi:sulfotransferase [Aliiroseovarius sp. F20344]|uniref:sulfotransferase n=1 Tax=Aliiroseovarius sp. F20344 TaxID=2926414 RepID=UPI001FF29943|nr:sulfotransferase [Aliiroseovarius sp. F20344]MCK0143088.1 sulfotransferase [Aliiroseovarius sp. F20344]